MHARTALAVLAALPFAQVGADPAKGQELRGQEPGDFGRAEALQDHHPGLFDLIERIEQAHAIVFEELAREPNADDFEVEWVERLTDLVDGGGTVGAGAEPFAALGVRAAEVIRWSQAFQREVLSILADPDVADPRASLAEAVGRYQSRADAALPSVPKNMDVLYGHAYALGFRTEYPDLDGLTWAGHWLRLAATEPLTDLAPGTGRATGIDTVTARYRSKLEDREPPQSYPSEIPLAPAIAPGLIWLSPESAMIWDNQSMLLEVLGDVLASAETRDVQNAIDATLDFFLDPELATTDQDEWEIMALRHGIFFQGGFPLAVMTENERNVGGHAAHLQGGGMLRTIPGMPRR